MNNILQQFREETAKFEWKNGCLTVTVTDVTANDEVSLCATTDMNLFAEDYVAAIEARLPRYQMENVPKQKILAAVRAASTRLALLGSLVSLTDNSYILGEFAEILTASN